MKTKTDLIVTVLLIVILIMIMYPVSGPLKLAFAEPIDTYQSSWQRIEDSAVEDGADFETTLNIDANEGDWSNKTSEAFHIIANYGNLGARYSPGTQWMFAFFGSDADSDTFSFDLVGWASTNGFAQIICEGDGVLGAQDVVIEPNGDAAGHEYWADTINLDETTKWDQSGSDPNNITVINSGDNQVAILIINLRGIEWIDFVTYDCDGSGGEAATIGVYGRRY
jgi:hypothetical protein